MMNPSARRVLIAAVAFIAHHPGVRILLGLKLRAWARRLNVALLVATLLATAVVAASVSWAWAGAAFLCGHFLWSAVYAVAVLVRCEEVFVADAAKKRAGEHRASL